MRRTKTTNERASLALLMLAGCSSDGFDGEEQRDYDNCFESGDGTAVVCEIMRRATSNPRIMAILKRFPACRYVALESWIQTYNEAI